ncbi:hypothetical protein MAR_038166 [Mya arenaria]|uniref:Copper transport protein n=1 Tax=Mya arenaria TaxID=6604 RepID=A0ABY7FSE0_MYAAR|nr:hypothetical protein MAR_038166 [Mya arenaria]
MMHENMTHTGHIHTANGHMPPGGITHGHMAHGNMESGHMTPRGITHKHMTHENMESGHMINGVIKHGQVAHGNMVFSASYQRDFILKDVKISTVGGIVGAMLVVILLATFLEGFKHWLYIRQRNGPDHTQIKTIHFLLEQHCSYYYFTTKDVNGDRRVSFNAVCHDNERVDAGFCRTWRWNRLLTPTPCCKCMLCHEKDQA